MSREEEILDEVQMLEPNLLIDVTSVALCFKHQEEAPFHPLPPDSKIHLFRAFDQRGLSRKATYLGQILNDCLDEILALRFREGIPLAQMNITQLIQKNIRYYLLRLMSTQEYLEASPSQRMETLRSMALDLSRGWEQRFSRTFGLETQIQRILPLLEGASKAYWEVPLLSHRLGLSGRCDVQLIHEDGSQELVELKSAKFQGKRYEPTDAHWVAPEHQIQTQLYQEIFSEQNKPFEQMSVWYSGKLSDLPVVREVQPLTPPKLAQINTVRNEIVQRILQLCEAEGVARVFREMMENMESIPKFQEGTREFVQTLRRLKSLEHFEEIKAYLVFMTQFIAREWVSSQIERYHTERSQVQSALWLKSIAEKAEAQTLLYDLSVSRKWSAQDTQICLVENQKQNSRFRKGDRLYLYVQHDLSQKIPDDLLICEFHSMTKIQDQTEIIVELKSLSPSMEKALLNPQNRFVLEEYKGGLKSAAFVPISAFLTQMNIKQRSILLAKEAPSFEFYVPRTDEDERIRIAQKAVHAQNLFLIQGPPGCGKTSTLIPSLVTQSLAHKESLNILILAFTNQATYAICKSLAQKGIDFLQHGKNPKDFDLGAEHSWYHHNSLSEFLSQNKEDLSAAEIVKKIEKTQVFISTIASANDILLNLKKFDLLILDEASQVHESGILQVLSQVPKWILIGDHKQLPPVMTQNDNYDLAEPLIQMGFGAEDGTLRPQASIMERLWRLCEYGHKSKNWPECTAMIETQYRMHPEVQNFPSQQYYGGLLRFGGVSQHLADLYQNTPGNGLEVLYTERVVAIHVDLRSGKEIQSQVLSKILRILSLTLKKGVSLGVLMPFRVDLNGLHRDLLTQNMWEELAQNFAYKQDTVERFQGGEREIILYAPGLSHPSQSELVQSILPSSQGEVDTKLNVAWTRAKEQLILVGDFEIWSQIPHYQAALSAIPEKARLKYSFAQETFYI